ncbi:MAG TPA: TIGR03545 family protein, partial [Pseudobdellovibrionaceae bacterium]|nr:TIGR03545 family protein [Pseudobdellovibrionaceae bacterium]
GALNVQSSLKALREFELRLGNQFNNVAYNISAKNEVVSSLLKGVFNALPAVTLDARFSGTLPRINTSVNSNLGPELQKGLSREINAKIAEARAKIEAYVQEQVGKTKAQIDAEIAKLRDQVDGEVKKLQAQADAKKKEVEAQKEKAKKDAEASAKKGLENEAKKAADQLKKRLGL